MVGWLGIVFPYANARYENQSLRNAEGLEIDKLLMYI